MKKYTEKIHAQRLLKMLEKDDPCACCPAAKNFYVPTILEGISWLNNADPDTMWSNATREYHYDTHTITYGEVCEICKHFVGCGENGCPCIVFGEQEAIKRTWIALEAKGYI